MEIDHNLVIVIVCVVMGVLVLGVVAASIVQEQINNHKRLKRNEMLNSSGYYILGIQKGEEHLQEYGLQSAEDYIKSEIPVNFITQVDAGFTDYVDYYKEYLHGCIMLPLSNINKDNNPQGDKMVTLPKDFDQACKNFHTIEESRWKQAIRKKINNRKQELSKFGFKENTRW